MDGLECSEIRMSDVCDTTTLRFDSDYYKKEYLEIEQFICKNRDKFVTIESQGLQVDASAFYPSLEPYYNTGTIPFVRVADVKDQIEYNACVNIPEMGEEFRTLHMCYPGDVVLTKGGRVGTAGLITQPSYVTRDLIFINASALSRKDYIVLYLFFSSSFAYKQYYSRFLPAIWKVDGVDDKLLIRAIREARSARFEFGETPKGR